MLDYDDGVSSVGKLIYNAQKLMHIGHVQAGRRLVEDIHRRARAAARKLGCELHSLRLTAGERRARLAEHDVAEADIIQRIELCLELREVFKECACLLDCHVENIADVLALVAHLECFAVISLALAYVAGNIYIRQEVHLDFLHTVTLTGLAPAALDVKGKPSRIITAQARILGRGKELADIIEQTRICRRV